MNCLHCGDCCLRMSPYSAPDPCLYLKQHKNFYFCGIYENRPADCIKHSFPGFRHCPIGIEKLNIDTPLKISIRIDEGYTILKTKLFKEKNKNETDYQTE